MWNHLPSGYLLDKIIYDEQPNDQNKEKSHIQRKKGYTFKYLIFLRVSSRKQLSQNLKQF